MAKQVGKILHLWLFSRRLTIRALYKRQKEDLELGIWLVLLNCLPQIYLTVKYCLWWTPVNILSMLVFLGSKFGKHCTRPSFGGMHSGIVDVGWNEELLGTLRKSSGGGVAAFAGCPRGYFDWNLKSFITRVTGFIKCIPHPPPPVQEHRSTSASRKMAGRKPIFARTPLHSGPHDRQIISLNFCGLNVCILKPTYDKGI